LKAGGTKTNATQKTIKSSNELSIDSDNVPPSLLHSLSSGAPQWQQAPGKWEFEQSDASNSEG
jgi:hypothetical protein